jgi:hypothetical protein
MPEEEVHNRFPKKRIIVSKIKIGGMISITHTEVFHALVLSKLLKRYNASKNNV